MSLWKRKKPASTLRSRPRQRRQRRRERFVFLLGLLAISVALALLGFALYERQIGVPRQPVARVNGVVIDARQLVRELKWIEAQAMTKDEIFNLLGQGVLAMQNQELIRQESQKLGLSASSAEINQFIQKQFLGEEPPEGKVAQVEELYQEHLRRLQLSNAEYRSQVEKVLRQDKLTQYLQAQLPQEAEQVYLHVIELEGPDLAEELRARIEAGEDFASLAKAFSLNPVSGPQGGEAGWLPRGARPYLDEVAFSIGLNQVSDPIPGPQGRLFLLKVSDKQVRPVDEEAKKEIEANALYLWLDQARAESKIEGYLSNVKVITWVLDQVKPKQG